jgi:hypothetical protein
LINFVGIVGPQPLTPSNLSVEVKSVAHIKFSRPAPPIFGVPGTPVVPGAVG